MQIQLSAQSIDTIWSENWEGNWISNWYVDGGTWEVGVPTYGPDSSYEGTKCAATVLAGPYTQPVHTRLIRIGKFTVPQAYKNPRLRFRHYFSFASRDFGYVQIKTVNGNWQNISQQYISTSSNTWTYTSIDLNAYADSLVQIAFYFSSDDDGLSTNDVSAGWYIDNIHLITGNYNFNPIEGFENGIGDWSTDRGVWEVGHPTSGPGAAYSGQNCLATVLGGNYQNGMRTMFISPVFKIRPALENPSLRFWHWYSLSSVDYGWVYIKTINQDNWQILSNSFSGSSSNVWTTYYYDLTDYADSIVQIGFYFTSDDDGWSSNDVSSGWYIDDITIDGVSISTVTYPKNDLSIQWLEPVSNPVCGTSAEQTISVRLENKGINAVSNFSVGYSIDNGATYINETVFQTVEPGATLDYSFLYKANMANADSFKCLAMVNVPYDINDTNNTVTETIFSNLLKTEFETTETQCNKASGTALIKDISGREGPFSIHWTSGDTDMSAENLASGTYYVTIMDVQGCSWTKSVVINDEGAPDYSVSSSVINGISCYGRKDGNIYIYPTGGVPPYTFRWSTGALTQDISDLGKGQYDLSIKDSRGCSRTHGFIINEPGPLKISASSTSADCGEMNGSAALVVNGGTKPYSYFWTSGQTSSSVTGLSGGVYTAYVTDIKGCKDSAIVSINDADAPGIIVTSVTPASCGNSDGGINISMADNNSQYTYLWSTGSVTQDLSNVSSGFYNVRVSYSESLCSSNQIIEVPTKLPQPGIICMVSIDSTTDEPFIIMENWEVPGQITSYNVYQLSKTGTYQFMETKDPEVSNTVTDAGSNPEVTSYRYRVTTMDFCGNESEPGPFHETIHTVATPDFNLTRANILWNSYKGIDYTYFIIYRSSESIGFEIIDTVPKTEDTDFYTYTDLNPPMNDTVYYVIGIKLTEPCLSNKKATSHNSVRSNKSKKLSFGGENISGSGYIKHFSLYPNPNAGSFKVIAQTSGNQDIILNIFDAQGRTIRNLKYYSITTRFEELIEIPGIKAGIYYLQIVCKDGMISRSFVVD